MAKLLEIDGVGVRSDKIIGFNHNRDTHTFVIYLDGGGVVEVRDWYCHYEQLMKAMREEAGAKK